MTSIDDLKKDSYRRPVTLYLNESLYKAVKEKLKGNSTSVSELVDLFLFSFHNNEEESIKFLHKISQEVRDRLNKK